MSPSAPAAPARDAVGREIRTFMWGDSWLEYITHGAETLRPLVLLPSAEYPGWPTQEFCGLAEQAGFRTVCLRRPGFGKVPALPDPDRQTAFIAAFLADRDLADCVLVCSGTSNVFGYRLVQHPNVGLTVLANCCFNFYPLTEIRPEWLARQIEQTLSSVTGARMALMGLKGAHGIFGKSWVVENFMQKSAGDLAYLRDNRGLFMEAVDCLLEGLDIHTFMMELCSTLKEDALLQDGCFGDAKVISVTGSETSEAWQSAIRAETRRVGVPLHILPSGDALVVHRSAREFLDLLGRCA